MNGLRKTFGFLMALALATLALSSGAAFADKTYTLSLSPATGATSPVATMTATLTNTGNSSFNSFTLQLPNGYSLSATPSISASKGQVSYNGTTRLITVTNIGLPVGAGAGEVITVTMNTLTVTTGSCGSGTPSSWVAAAYGGSSLNGAPFSGNAFSTTVAPQCYTVTGSSSDPAKGTVNNPTTVLVAPGPSATASFTVTPNTAAGYKAVTATGTCPAGSLVGNTYTTGTLTGSCNLIANFGKIPETVAAVAGAHGTIAPASQVVDFGTPATGTVTADTANHYHVASVTGTADCNGVTPATGPNWTTGGVTGGSCTVTASFAIDQVHVSTSSSGPGSITPPSKDIDYNTTTTFTVAPTDPTQYYAAATGCNGSLSGTTYTTGTVTSACTVSATFSRKTLLIINTPNSTPPVIAPTSIAVNTPFDVIVGIQPAGATVSIGFDAACAAAGAAATQTPSGDGTSTKFTVTVPNMPSTGTCTITFTPSDPGYQNAQLSNLKVYKGVLFCGNYDSVNGPGDPAYDPDLPALVPNQVPPVVTPAYVGTPGWGLRRGPNKDGADCIKVNYTCDLNDTTNVASCTFDKASGQKATFKYLFLWGSRGPDPDGWTSYRPQVAWNIDNPDMTTANAFKLPDWVPLLSCISDMFPALPTLPTTILPFIPNVPPFDSAANTHDWYKPFLPSPPNPPNTPQQALVCGAQQGWTSVGTPPNVLIQTWDIIIDESDIVIKGPG